MRQHWLIATAMLAAGCTTTPVPSSSAKPIPIDRVYSVQSTTPEEGRALLVVTRDKGWKAQACIARLYVDGELVADLKASEQIRLYVAEGPHLVGVSGERCLGGADQASVEVTRAKPVLLRVSMGGGVGMKIEPSAF
ncbi:MAG TPA: hypothetical protein VJL86_10700 [Steroidobacteraceae bacterium]|jgi:hypothetical protein|nr:hypothetical protein [Steroidobacteraceae bacterium]